MLQDQQQIPTVADVQIHLAMFAVIETTARSIAGSYVIQVILCLPVQMLNESEERILHMNSICIRMSHICRWIYFLIAIVESTFCNGPFINLFAKLLDVIAFCNGNAN